MIDIDSSTNHEVYLKYKETYQNYYQENKDRLIEQQKDYYKFNKKDRIYFQRQYNNKLSHSRNYRNLLLKKKEEKNQELVAKRRVELLKSLH